MRSLSGVARSLTNNVPMSRSPTHGRRASTYCVNAVTVEGWSGEVDVGQREGERLGNPEPRARQQAEQRDVRPRPQAQSRDRPQLRRGLEQRHDFRLRIDVRDTPTRHWTEETGGHHLRVGVEHGVILRERSERLQAASPGEAGAARRALRPPHGQGARDGTAMTLVVGEPGEGAQLPFVTPQIKSQGSPGREVDVDLLVHRGHRAHATPPGQGAATVASWGRSSFV
jgi:hypothetical protein